MTAAVDYYVFDPDDDPITRTWQRALPDLFKAADAMAGGCCAGTCATRRTFLLAQGLIFTKYHMTNPEVFYNQEDLWVRATEKHYDEHQTGGALLRDVGAARTPTGPSSC